MKKILAIFLILLFLLPTQISATRIDGNGVVIDNGDSLSFFDTVGTTVNLITFDGTNTFYIGNSSYPVYLRNNLNLNTYSIVNGVNTLTVDATLSLSDVVTDLSDLGLTASETEINYLSGVTSNVQTQINALVSGTIASIGDIDDVTITDIQDGEFFVWNTDHWENTDFSGLGFADVATSGDYADLINTPSIPTATSDISNDSGFITASVSTLTNYTLSSALHAVATSGSYTDLTNKPTIPTATSDLSNDSGFITNAVNDLVNYTLTSSLDDVATSGDYNDLINTPSIPSATSDLSNDSGFITASVSTLTNYTLSSSLATVATSGLYSDLTGTPSIPSTVDDLSDGTTYVRSENNLTDALLSKLNGIASGAEVNVNADWNSSSGDSQILNKPTIPSNTSDLSNDSGFITNSTSGLTNYTLTSSLSTVATSGSYTDLSNVPSTFTPSTHSHTLSDVTDVTVSTTEINYLSGASSNIQNQINALVSGTIASVGDIDDVTITSAADNDVLIYDIAEEEWINSTLANAGISSTSHTHSLADLTGTMDNITDGSTFVKTENNLTDALLSKLNGISSGAEVNVNADWNSESGDSQILNKPTIPTAVSDLSNDSGFITNSTAGLTNYTLTSSLSTVATSGAYNDLSGTPTIPTNTSDLSNDSGFITNAVNDLSNYTLTSSLATVATTGAYTDLTGTPTIPTATSDLSNDSGFITNSTSSLTNYTLTSALDNVATSGSYNDLSDTPTIPATVDDLTDGTTYVRSENNLTDALLSKLNGIATGAEVNVQSDWNATEGDALILNKPTIPSATSDLSNDSGFITNSTSSLTNYTLTSSLSTVATSGSYTDLSNKPTIPTATSDLSNDSGFITNAVSNLTNYTLTSSLGTVATSNSYTDLDDKPTIPTTADDLTDGTTYVRTENNLTDALLSKLNGVASGAEVNVQSDWNATEGDALILNKPTIPTATSDLSNDSGFITNSTSSLTNYTLTSALDDVATSGSYTDLSDVPSTFTPSSHSHALSDVTGITVSTTEINYLSGASSNIQNQIDALVSGTIASIGDIDDVNITTVADNNVLQYNSVAGEWQNESLADAGISAVGHTHVMSDITDLSIPDSLDDLTGSLDDIADGSTYVRTENNLTDALLSKLNGVATGAEVNVQSDWNATEGDALILNKPSIPTATSDLSNDSGFITNSTSSLTNYTLTSSLSTVATSGSYNDLSDKPSIPTNTSDLSNDSGFITNSTSGLTNYTLTSALDNVATSGSYNDLSDTPTIYTTLAGLTDTNIVEIGDGEILVYDTGTSKYINQTLTEAGFSTVATTGSYNDLSNTPTIPTATSDLSNDSGFITNSTSSLTNYTLSSSLSTVATTGAYSDLTGTPSIPTATSDLSNDSGFITNATSSLTNYTLTSSLSTVATSGAYADLTGKPTIPASLGDLTGTMDDITNGTTYVKTTNDYTTTEKNKLSGIEASATADQTGSEIKSLYEAESDTNAFTDALLTKLNGISAGAEVNVNADWNSSSGDSQILNKPSLATVATTGAYSDLTGTPTIPTATSDLSNDSGFITNSVSNLTNYTLTSSLSTVATSGSYNDLSNKPSIPTEYTNENAQDTIGGILTDSSTVDFTYDDELNTITASTLDAAINHDALLNFSADEHFTQAAISITAGQVSNFDTEVANNSTVSANTSSRHNAVTIGTANGLSLSTQQISLTLANTTTTGALSSTDWNTFNGKVDDLADLSITATSSEINILDGATLTVTELNYVDGVTSGIQSQLNTLNAAIPSATSDLSNDSGFITNSVSNLTNYTLTSSLGAVATSNSYTDLDDKPTIPNSLDDLSGTMDDITNGTTYVKTTNDYTTTEKNKLSGIETAATADQTGSEIKSLYEAQADTNALTDTLLSKLNGISSGAEVNVQSDWNATEGDSLILNKPTIPTATSDLSNDSGFITTSTTGLTNYTLTSSLSTVATSGSYNDLSDKPSIPSEYTNENAQDTIGGILTDSSTVDFTYNDEANTITAVTIDGAIDHDSLLNFSADEHFTQASISIPASQISDFDTEVSNNSSVSSNTTHSGLTTGNPHSVSKSDVGLGSVENTALSTWVGTTNITTLGTITSGTWSGNDLTASQISDFDTEVSNNTDVSANTSARHNAVTIGTANGLSLSTQQISLALSSTSTTGALSSTDWNTFNNKVDDLGDLSVTATASELNILDDATLTTTELNYVDGVTSSIQTQLNSKFDTDGSTSMSGNLNVGTHNIHSIGYLFFNSSGTIYSGSSSMNTISFDIYNGESFVEAFRIGSYSNATNTSFLDLDMNNNDIINVTSLNGITSTEIGYLDDITSSVQTQLNAKIESLSDLSITSTASELNILDGATLNVTELNYVDGVTSSIQTQLNALFSTSGGTFTGAVTTADHGTATNPEVVNVIYGDENATPPTASTVPIGTLWIQYDSS